MKHLPKGVVKIDDPGSPYLTIHSIEKSVDGPCWGQVSNQSAKRFRSFLRTFPDAGCVSGDGNGGKRREEAMYSRQIFHGLIAALLVLAAGFSGAEGGERALVPIPALFYGPETGFGGGGALLYTWPGPPAQEPNQAGGILFYTQKRQLISALFTESALGTGVYRLLASGSVRRYPDSYFGIGSDSTSADEERYTPWDSELEVGFLRRLGLAFSAGPFYRFRYSALQETEAGGALESGLITGSDETWVSGGGLRLRYDSREGGFATSRGSYAEFKGGIYFQALGGSEDFGLLELDVRQYIPLLASQVLALQAIAAVSWGMVPFQELSELGGDMMMRGYLAGRYRFQMSPAGPAVQGG